MEAKLIGRLESAVARLESLLSSGFVADGRDAALSGDDPTADSSIVAFDDLKAQYVGSLITTAEKIGGPVLDVAMILQEAFVVQKELLIKKPDPAVLVEFLKPLNEVISKAGAMTEGKRSDIFNHLKAAVDSLSALAWIAFTGKDCGMSMPIAHIEQTWEMAEFYSNKASSSEPKDGMSAAFQQISSGNVTAGLSKVTDDMKTKNRVDRTGIVGSCTSEKESRAVSNTTSKTCPPNFELQMGRKWVVENQIGNKDLVIGDCDAKQSVYIYGCKNSVLQILGKINNITVDKCKKMGVLFKDVVAACEIVIVMGLRCSVRYEGSAPTISEDNTSGCQLYLSKDSLEASISTAKSSEINVLVPGSTSDGDWVEHALPQQYFHAYKEDDFVTTTASHSGA